MKTFIYLINSMFGDKNFYKLRSSNSDVLVVAHRKMICSDYFLPNSTWASGRNFLLKKVQEYETLHNFVYMYYIFMDEDAFSCRLKKKKKTCWKYLEQRLLLDKPAVAIPRFSELDNRYSKSDSEVDCIFRHDAQLNAYSRNASKYLIPYLDITDSWAVGAVYSELKSFKYIGNILMYNQVIVENKYHAHYPGSGKYGGISKKYWKYIYKQLQNDFGKNDIKLLEYLFEKYTLQLNCDKKINRIKTFNTFFHKL